MPEHDEKLLREATGGDPDALSELLRRHGPGIQAALDGRIASRYRSAFGIRDVMQVTYMEAFLRIKNFEPNGMESFIGWLRKIAKNNLIDAIRELDAGRRPPRDKAIHRPPPDQTYATLLGNLTGTTSTPSRHAAQGEARQLLEQALAKLPPDYEQAVRQLDLEGRLPEDVAESLGRSKGAVHMLRARAHDRLKELLGSPAQFFTDTP